MLLFVLVVKTTGTVVHVWKLFNIHNIYDPEKQVLF